MADLLGDTLHRLALERLEAEARRREQIALTAYALTDEDKRDRLHGIEHAAYDGDVTRSWTIASSIDTKFRCAECGQEIPEGMHYVIAAAWTATRMPADYVPVVPMAFPPEVEGIYCTPLHLLQAIIDSPEMRSTFG